MDQHKYYQRINTNMRIEQICLLILLSILRHGINIHSPAPSNAMMTLFLSNWLHLCICFIIVVTKYWSHILCLLLSHESRASDFPFDRTTQIHILLDRRHFVRRCFNQIPAAFWTGVEEPACCLCRAVMHLTVVMHRVVVLVLGGV